MEPLNTVSSMVSDSAPVGHCAHGWRPLCPKRCRSRPGPSCWPARFSSSRGGRCQCRCPEPELELPVRRIRRAFRPGPGRLCGHCFRDRPGLARAARDFLRPGVAAGGTALRRSCPSLSAGANVALRPRRELCPQCTGAADSRAWLPERLAAGTRLQRRLQRARPASAAAVPAALRRRCQPSGSRRFPPLALRLPQALPADTPSFARLSGSSPRSPSAVQGSSALAGCRVPITNALSPPCASGQRREKTAKGL